VVGRWRSIEKVSWTEDKMWLADGVLLRKWAELRTRCGWQMALYWESELNWGQDVVGRWRSIEKVSWTEDKRAVIFVSSCLFRTFQIQRNWLSVSLYVCNIYKRIKWGTICVNCGWRRQCSKYPVNVHYTSYGRKKNMATARSSASD